MSLTALKGLASSRKATVMVAVLVLLGVGVYSGQLAIEDALDVVKYVVPTWFGAHAYEVSKKAAAEAEGYEDEAAADEADES